MSIWDPHNIRNFPVGVATPNPTWISTSLLPANETLTLLAEIQKLRESEERWVKAALDGMEEYRILWWRLDELTTAVWAYMNELSFVARQGVNASEMDLQRMERCEEKLHDENARIMVWMHDKEASAAAPTAGARAAGSAVDYDNQDTA